MARATRRMQSEVRPRRPAGPAARGFSLVELLVALVIGLLGTYAIFQAFSAFEGQKRTTTGANDAQQNGAYSLFLLDQSIRQAGAGLTTTFEGYFYPRHATGPGTWDVSGAPPTSPNYLLGCNTRVAGRAGTFVMAPVLIVSTGRASGGSDVIQTIGGSSSGFAIPVSADIPVTGGAALGVAQGHGFRRDDLVVVARSYPPDAAYSQLCSVARLANVPALPTSSPANITLTLAQELGYAYNGPAFVYNLGPDPVAARFEVQGDRLVYTDLLGRTAGAVALAEGIVHMQAQYGVDVDNDDVIDAWVTPTAAQSHSVPGNVPQDWRAPAAPAAPLPPPAPGFAPGTAQVNHIKALRIGLIARSAQKERPDAGGCLITGADSLDLQPLPVEAGADGAPAKPAGYAVDLARGDPEWACYRYRAFSTVIPIRNMLWSDL